MFDSVGLESRAGHFCLTRRREQGRKLDAAHAFGGAIEHERHGVVTRGSCRHGKIHPGLTSGPAVPEPRTGV
jgi:hypothetical protein